VTDGQGILKDGGINVGRLSLHRDCGDGDSTGQSHGCGGGETHVDVSCFEVSGVYERL